MGGRCLFLATLLLPAILLALPPGVTVHGPELVSGDAPHYPAIARERAIDGVVSLELTLNDRGEVADAIVVSGPLALRRSALLAVLNWRFQPTATTASVDLNFDSKTPPPPIPSPLDRIRVPEGTQEAKLLSAPRVFYPPLARQARISGDVRFEIVIAKDGEVRNMTLLSGHPLLVSSATEAIRRARYSPTVFNGQAMEVATEVTVSFKLANLPPSP